MRGTILYLFKHVREQNFPLPFFIAEAFALNPVPQIKQVLFAGSTRAAEVHMREQYLPEPLFTSETTI